MRIAFSKYHGCGNDFVVVDTIGDPRLAAYSWRAIARDWCKRQFGVGADQLLVVCDGDADCHASLRIFNADGGEAEMCGNGLRCVARVLVERRGVGAEDVRIRTARGVLHVMCELRDGQFQSACVDMGPPALNPGEAGVVGTERTVSIPTPGDLPRTVVNCMADLGATGMTCVGMGNPHAVLFVNRVPEDQQIALVGAAMERSSMFPRRTNVQFARVLAPDRIAVRTWERGAGMTLACGSGACAVAVAAALEGRCGDEAAVELAGGVLHVRWRREHGNVLLTGPAAHVFDGTIEGIG